MRTGVENAGSNHSAKKIICFLRLMAAVVVCCLTSSFSLAQQKEVAITFDDLPAHGNLPGGVTRSDIVRNVVRVLRENGVPGGYGFVNGSRQENDPDRVGALKLWRDAGFPLGSHTFSHIDLTKNTAEAFESDIAANEATLKGLMGDGDWHWFRYPFLHEGDTLEKRREVRKYLLEHKYKVAQVTLDFEDYAWNNPYARCVAAKDAKSIEWLKTSYLETAAEYISLGQKMAVQLYGHDIKHILLLHIGAFDSAMLPELLQLLKKQGFTFISLEEATKDPVYQKDPDAALKFGGTLLEQFFDSRHLKYPPFQKKPLQELENICR